MSRRKVEDELGDMLGKILVAGVLVAGAIAVMVGMTIAEWLRTPTEEQLRRLTPNESWGEFIP